MIIVNVQFRALASPSRPLCNRKWYQKVSTNLNKSTSFSQHRISFGFLFCSIIMFYCSEKYPKILIFCSIWTKIHFHIQIPRKKNSHLFTPFSIVSSTSVDASCTNVLALALENPEIAEDSESEDRRDRSIVGDTTNRGPFFVAILFVFVFLFFFFLKMMFVMCHLPSNMKCLIWFFLCIFFAILTYISHNTVSNSRIQERNVPK